MVSNSDGTPESVYRSPAGPGWVGVPGDAPFQPRDVDEPVDDIADPRALMGDLSDDEDLSDLAPWEPEDD